MSVQSVCLGWHWQPYAYSRTADDTDGAPVKPLPTRSSSWPARRRRPPTARQRRGASRFAPDAAIVNLYAPGARLGLHQDGEEPADAPVVTISLGDTCVFRLAGVDRRTAPFTDIELRSGDLLVFGGANRRIYHGVPKVLDGTAPPGSACRPAGSASPCARPGCRVTARCAVGVGLAVADRAVDLVCVQPFEDVVAEHGPVVMRVCRALLGPADADDAWSETFLVRAAGLPATCGPDSNVRGWLVTIAHRKAIDQIRAAQHARPLPVGELPEVPSHDRAARRRRRRAARRRSTRLPAKQRGAVVYHYLAGLPYAEVAALLGSSEAAARRSAADGIASLRTTYPKGTPR